MKKFVLAIAFFVSLFSTQAQKIDVGIMFAPNLSLNRVLDQAEDWDISNDGIGMRFSAGPIADIFVTDNVAFSTGIFFCSKRSAVSGQESTQDTSLNVQVNLQYVQVPVGLKFFTNEIANKLKIYFSLHGSIEGKINELIVDYEDEQDWKFAKPFDAGMHLGAGVELNVGQSNAAFFGVNYNRGLINIIRGDFHEVINKDEIRYHNDQFSLIAGFKF